MKIIKASEPIVINTLSVLIYGEPGIGKTTLASTYGRALILDCDGGAHRAAYRGDIIRLEQWFENYKELGDVLTQYDCLVVDTVDTLLSYMGAAIIDKQPNLTRNKLWFFGRLKEEFKMFRDYIKTRNKMVFYIAHVKEIEENAVRIKRPMITGGSYDILCQYTDLIGYMYNEGKSRILEFGYSDYFIGKDFLGLGKIQIPDVSEISDFLRVTLNNALDRYNGVITPEAWLERYSEPETIDGWNYLLKELSETNYSKEAKLKIFNHLKSICPYEYDTKSKKFVKQNGGVK